MEEVRYRCSDWDRLDLVVIRHYGDLSMHESVVEANPHLAKLPLILKSGTEILLPVKTVSTPISELKTKEDMLW